MKLEAQSIVKHFSGNKILHEISFEVNSSRIMGFLGRNGAGKTTTIRCLVDVFKQDSGTFLLDGKVFDPYSVKIGYLPEDRGMYQKSTLLDQLAYFACLRGATRKEAIKSAKYWIARFGLTEYEKKHLEVLSKGNQQKIQIAQAILNDPDILILDEPFSGLDPVNAQVFKDIIVEFAKNDKLVIFSSHQMSYVEELCDDVTLIDKGHILVNGDLKALKRELGENKAVVKADNMSNEHLLELLGELSPELTQQGVVVTSPAGKSHQELLGHLQQTGIEIAKFDYYEPSLQDIFVRLVSDNHA